MFIQTRSEKTGINGFYTLEEALRAAEQDKTIWKISFALDSGERVRLVRRYYSVNKTTDWVYEPISLEYEP